MQIDTTKLKEMVIGEKSNIIIGVCVIGIVAVLWGMYGRADVPDIRDGANAVGAGLDATQNQQRKTTDAIGTVEAGLVEASATAHRSTEQLDEIGATNTDLINRNADSQASVTASGEIITRLQDRFQKIRERGKQ